MNDAKQTHNDVDAVLSALPSLETYIRSHGNGRGELRSEGGNQLRGAHPVHGSDTGANFSVNTQTESWYCHRHKVGGGLLEYIAVDEGVVNCEGCNHIGMDFPTVLEIAADKAGISLNHNWESQKKAAEWREERERVDRTMAEAADYWVAKRKATELDDALRRSYGLEPETLEDAKVGYAPAGDDFVSAMADRDVSEDELLEAGLAVKTAKGVKPFFEGRIVFPYWQHSKVRYFIGRKTEYTPDNPWENGKYKKVPRHSEKFDYVSEVVAEPVFGVDTVKGEPTAVVTEGITDAMVLHQLGIPAVSPVTVRFKQTRVDQAARALAGKEVVAVFDEDAESGAGLSGSVETAQALASSGRPKSVSVARLPSERGESTDVADYYAREGETALRDALRDTVGAYVASYLWGGGEVADLVAGACLSVHVSPNAFAVEENEDGEEFLRTVWEVFDYMSDPTDLREAYYRLESVAKKLSFDGKRRRDVYEFCVWHALNKAGDFFQTERGAMYYFDGESSTVIPVDGDGQSALSADFTALIHERYALSSDQWGRVLFSNLYSRALRNAPVKDAYRFAHYDDEAGALYVSRFDSTYYRLDGETVELRRNGEDLFFLPEESGSPYTYLPESDRPAADETFPGERPTWRGSGDLVHRLVTNRVNYAEAAALAPADQRDQLYLHLHTLPFMSILDSRPIMAWVGEKGSGKTAIQRSVGQFVYGPEYTESFMPDKQDDFVAMVSNSPLAFIDNYDEGLPWADDILAAVSTGARLKKRQLFTTNTMREVATDCWLSLTSRTPPFRRDDVADRTLVFRVERLGKGEFVGERTFYDALVDNRDAVWSDYLDNLNRVVAHLNDGADRDISTTFRMASWAILCHVVGEALGVDNVGALLESMRTEQARFALEEEPIGLVLAAWSKLSDDGGHLIGPDDMAVWRSASKLVEDMNQIARDERIALDVSSPQGMASKVNQLESELKELYGLETKPAGRSKAYRFVVNGGRS